MILWLIFGAMLLLALLCVLPSLLRPGGYATQETEQDLARPEMAVALYRADQAEAEREFANGQLLAQQYAEVQQELERRLLDDAQAAEMAHGATAAARMPGTRANVTSVSMSVLHRAGLAALLLALLPSAALLLYLKLGNPAAALAQSGTDTSEAERHADSPASLDAMIARLAARLARQPDDAQGWSMLARSYTVLGRAGDAVLAYQRALALTPNDSLLLADYADALASANGGVFDAAAAQQIHAALALDPGNLKALALAGSMALDQRDYPQAEAFWQRLEHAPGVTPDIAAQARQQIANAQRLAQQPAQRLAQQPAQQPAQSAPATDATPRVATSPRVLEVHVRLSPQMAARVHPSDTVFVLARAVDGPRMPLAVQRLRVADLPAVVRLDDALAMTPELRLSAFERVRVEAHVSASGVAQRQKGDLLGYSEPQARDSKTVEVVLDEVLK
ncbi:c-type cytochrome biogenesis protein CcmI [Paraburkholderia bonniea]|uniref:c-type cytochrome biogenesis protein CcmI n=1 Tax=Paraburkholderia bonniea TaxID=2152891 RepID=UPI00257298D9|nr:c-type cytochrome biogenesis protein CcmI [Paraburkholderia bonniea]WJF91961.1 c-type cytochrome biogenesis protein CcmI [Paraburkholderia bonniea]WJF95280.1 c-type cytochrome biogenesis protein CcmI [Paraburkholderia bonniea]